MVDSAARATAVATRLDPPRGETIAFVGDSLGVLGRRQLVGALDSPSSTVVFDTASGRTITSNGLVRSGIDAVRRLQGSGVRPDVWLIELGTNDVGPLSNCGCADPRAAATERIRQLLQVIGPHEIVYWVNVQNFAFPLATAAFNSALAELLRKGEIAGVVDWASLVAPSRREWFADDKHLTSTGYTVWAQLMATELADI